MKFTLVLVFCLELYRNVESVSNPLWTRSGEFCYDPSNYDCGPAVWPGVCLSGQHQSPIDIDYGIKFGKLGSSPGITLMQFNAAYGRTHGDFFAMNTGHSFQVQLERSNDPTSDLRFSGGGLSSDYVFAQLHFHWGRSNRQGSEHTLFGKRYPMELHIVHHKSKFKTLGDAMADELDPEAVAVFAVFFTLVDEDNPAMNGIIRAVNSQHTETEDTEFERYPFQLNVQDLLPKKLHFARYLGSLTTPPCTEHVVWTVFTHTVPISNNQLSSMRRVENMEMETYFNFRPIQPRNNRVVRYFKVFPIKRSFIGNYDNPSNLLLRPVLQILTKVKSIISDLFSLKWSWWGALAHFIYQIVANPSALLIPLKIQEIHIL